jgi:hypothetical protein
MAYNYVIAAVETPSGRVLLDDKFSNPNVLPLDSLVGSLIEKNGIRWVDLMPKVNYTSYDEYD